jgi:hypothetical protein
MAVRATLCLSSSATCRAFRNRLLACALSGSRDNDHSRRKFVEAGRNAPKIKKTPSGEGWVATKAIAFYKRLYKIEKDIRDLPPDQRYRRRECEAVPIWNTFMEWAKQVQTLGVRHAKTRKASLPDQT